MIGSFVKVHTTEEEISFVNGVFVPDITTDTTPHILSHFFFPTHLFYYYDFTKRSLMVLLNVLLYVQFTINTTKGIAFLSSLCNRITTNFIFISYLF